MQIPAYFHPSYAPIDVPLLARLATTHQRLERLGLIDTLVAKPIAPNALQGLHHEPYLTAFMQGQEPLASKQGITWRPSIRDATLAMLGAQVEAAQALFDTQNVMLNVARGFHHAHPAAGSGFCPMNGLALVAHVWPNKRVLVMDCDEHGGNGTEEFTELMPNLFNVSLFGTRFGCRGGIRSWAFHVTAKQGFGAYQIALAKAAQLMAQIKPDIVLYQAGADCHQGDPKSQLKLSTRQLFWRDLFVFSAAKSLQLPVLFVLAGGYQNAEKVAYLNANTVRAARWVWGAKGNS